LMATLVQMVQQVSQAPRESRVQLVTLAVKEMLDLQDHQAPKEILVSEEQPDPQATEEVQDPKGKQGQGARWANLVRLESRETQVP